MHFVVKSLVQAGVILLLATLIWGLYRGVARLRRRQAEGWSVWLGLTRPPSWRLGLTLFAVFLAVGALFSLSSHSLVPGHDAVIRESPAFKIANLPLASLILAAPAYAFVMTGFSEELLFRGLLAKRLIRWLGVGAGNLVQAALFGLMHVAVVYAVVPEPGIGLVAFAALGSAAIGWVLGWAMVRDGGSIFAPWLAHSAANLVTVFVYLAMFPSSS